MTVAHLFVALVVIERDAIRGLFVRSTLTEQRIITSIFCDDLRYSSQAVRFAKKEFAICQSAVTSDKKFRVSGCSMTKK